MNPVCPRCSVDSSDTRNVCRHGQFYRKSDSKWISRFRCLRCAQTFSIATTHPCFGQKKRRENFKIYKLMASGISQRRAAKILNLNRKTIERKFRFIAKNCEAAHLKALQNYPPIKCIQFDDMETHEHSKLKPLSITVAVEKDSRFILAAIASTIPCRGNLSKRSLKKYGPRTDGRRIARSEVFNRISHTVFAEFTEIQSDLNPHYLPSVKNHFGSIKYTQFKGRRGCITGQGELKRGGYDPLFSLNHTCAMFRANMNRLFRRTWNTTKKIHGLQAHLWIYIHFHNAQLVECRCNYPKQFLNTR